MEQSFIIPEGIKLLIVKYISEGLDRNYGFISEMRYEKSRKNCLKGRFVGPWFFPLYETREKCW